MNAEAILEPLLTLYSNIPRLNTFSVLVFPIMWMSVAGIAELALKASQIISEGMRKQRCLLSFNLFRCDCYFRFNVTVISQIYRSFFFWGFKSTLCVLL
jgi:hypothetical protein